MPALEGPFLSPHVARGTALQHVLRSTPLASHAAPAHLAALLDASNTYPTPQSASLTVATLVLASTGHLTAGSCPFWKQQHNRNRRFALHSFLKLVALHWLCTPAVVGQLVNQHVFDPSILGVPGYLLRLVVERRLIEAHGNAAEDETRRLMKVFATTKVSLELTALIWVLSQDAAAPQTSSHDLP